MFRYLLCLLGLLLALPLLAVIALALTLPITISGIGYLLASALIVAGLIAAPKGGRYPLVITSVGLIALALIASVRLILAEQSRTSRLTVVTLPQGGETRWLNVLVDEQDLLIFGETVFHLSGGDSPMEHEQVTAALHRSYMDLKGIRRVFPSPVISTYLNLQAPDAFDAIVIKPDVALHPDTAVIFLHGYMGSVTAQCWEVAGAVGEFGAVTVCPATEWRGRWREPAGAAILKATVQYLRQQRIEKFYLGGYSNGGYGISMLVSEISREDGLKGLFFIDGIDNGAGIRDTGLPALIIQAAQDERVSTEWVRQTAEIIGDQGTYVEVDGDHFMIMKQPEYVQRALRDWLESLTGR
jgi:pimeloyl-ACP methyl ester carboxylesterase